MSQIKWLQNWYSQNCNNQWEHSYGIEIGTLDNPGWYVNIGLKETKYESLIIEEVKRENGDDDWIICKISDSIFKGAGDSLKLEEILSIFKKIIED